MTSNIEQNQKPSPFPFTTTDPASDPIVNKANAVLSREINDYWDFIELARHELDRRFGKDTVHSSHLALMVNRTSSIMMQIAERYVHQPRNQSWTSFRLLFVLWNLGSIEQSRLGLLTGSSKATVANLVSSLQKEGLIDRVRSVEDRRTFLVTITDNGVRTVEEAYLEQNELLIQWLSVLDSEEKETLQQLVGKLLQRQDIFGAG